jgi:hypothetical protein
MGLGVEIAATCGKSKKKIDSVNKDERQTTPRQLHKEAEPCCVPLGPSYILVDDGSGVADAVPVYRMTLNSFMRAVC